MSALDRQMLSSDEEAISVGYQEGRDARKNGATDFAHERDLIEQGWKDERGERSPYNAEWREGFEAGFNGKPMPRN